MSDSLERLFAAVIEARDLDPEVSRTARLLQRGPSKMAKKLAEEAIEVALDAISGTPEAVVRESADLLYHLTVLWAAAGVTPADIWAEMARREELLGIAEKLPKGPGKSAKQARRVAARRVAAPRLGGEGAVVALASGRLRKRR